MTDLELRRSVVNVMRGWLGWSEANGKYRAIIDLYNSQRPLPRGYKVKYTDEWCAATVTAAGIQAGLSDIIFGECSCSRMVALYQQAGRWMEDDGYTPQIGDIVMYRWDDGANYATTDNTSNPNHVGIVAEVNGRVLTIIEGNKGQKVATRSLFVNGRYIRGYCLPDYASMAETEDDEEVTQEQFNQMAEVWMAQRGAQELTEDWQREGLERAVSAGITDGSRPLALCTRLEAAIMAAAGTKTDT